MSEEARRDRFTYTAEDQVLPAMCAFCRHQGRLPNIAVCAAFPGGIPDEILHWEFDHRRPWVDPETGEPGDVGIAGDASITFEPREGVTAVGLAMLYRQLDAIPR